MAHVIAIDFEAFGGITPLCAFTQLGAALIRVSDSAVLAQFNAYANQLGYVQEPRCLTEFWLKNDQNKQLFAQNCMRCCFSTQTPTSLIQLFVKWVGEVTVGIDDCIIITDNAGFDAGLLRAFSATVDPQYIFGEYRDIVDVSMVYYGLAGLVMNKKTLDMSSKQVALSEINRRRETRKLPPLELPVLDVPHDHNAVNDATTIALYWAFFQRELAALQ